ncbi:2OG-Fe(II) oxygenase [Marivirga salinae]|uniref:2OG-Fe(II) oxygenase n=1 Tax=Marivirga salinarum TaxID=3059078 RepID=A0AA51R9Z4_9BACT|nr:2OG-Fe(II) oxygenase [Marivirga sp. BDSF4-3]WMN12707.1 2OG-Fe(II) oxygenase [Marivirga sp. BDSF4-3]
MSSAEKLNLAIDQLSDTGYFIWDDFVTNEEVKKLVSIANQSNQSGDFKKAGIGKQALFQLDKSIRGDYIQWLDRSNQNQIVLQILDKMESLKNTLNETCYLGLKDFETHFAIYPENTFYKKHVDRFQQNAHRVISFVLYLNENWQEGNGGELAIYLENQTEIVQPLAGRLLLFRSELEHEVLMSYKKRYSVTGWMLDKDMSLTFLP